MDTSNKPATVNQALNMALTAAEYLRKYLPADELLTDADRMAISMLERAKQFN